MAVFQQQRVSEWFPPLNKKKREKMREKSCHLEAKISGKCLNILILVSQNVNLLTQTSEKIRQITFEILTWNFNLALPKKEKGFFFSYFSVKSLSFKKKKEYQQHQNVDAEEKYFKTANANACLCYRETCWYVFFAMRPCWCLGNTVDARPLKPLVLQA